MICSVLLGFKIDVWPDYSLLERVSGSSFSTFKANVILDLGLFLLLGFWVHLKVFCLLYYISKLEVKRVFVS
ncbi:hypothetical protein NC653_031168 [Populus alba x Populus x berolinensis]|uniref:Uncharacterized protein n=1 Tax=Populus alba x Populus x berolinensis TaxID=444605 RepID=A0AAD6Q1A1_9ROSI|nr:hypothetical protein NC653_031168 [Populus alba x Populus x berolinensis]